MKNKLLILSLFSVCLSLLTACSPKERDANTLVVGTISGPESDLMKVPQRMLKEQYGLNVEIIEFQDYLTPNMALNDGALDVNVYQHLPYLEMAVAARGYPLVSVARTFVFPMGVYSNRYKQLSDLPEGATVGIPNDPSNGARALILLEQAGLITTQSGNFQVSAKQIIENPKKLKFKELDAALLPRALDDLDAAAINTTFVIPAGLSPNDALIRENPASPYANIVVVREGHEKDENILHLIEAIQSDEVAEQAQKLFDGMAIPAWPAHHTAH